jgi:hypothetical protein
MPWKTPAERERLAACQQQSLEEAHKRGNSRQGTWNRGAGAEDEEHDHWDLRNVSQVSSSLPPFSHLASLVQ